MAAKHDGKKARANFWVMQQNLAKQKGGRPGFQFSEKKAPRPAKIAVPTRSEEPTAGGAPTDTPTSTESGNSTEAAHREG